MLSSRVDVMSCKVPMVSCMQWVWFHTYIDCDVISQVGLITQIHWVSCQIQSLWCIFVFLIGSYKTKVFFNLVIFR